MTDHRQYAYPSPRGALYYTPVAANASAQGLPAPPCRPRPRRPHTIHIAHLRHDQGILDPDAHARSRVTVYFSKLASRENAKRVLGSVWSPFAHAPVTPPAGEETPNSPRSAMGTRSPWDVLQRVPAEHAMRGRNGTAAQSDDGAYLARSAPGGSTMPRNRPLQTAEAERMVAPLIVDASRPVCAGNGVSCAIILAEPTLYLQGLDHDGTTRHSSSTGAICRGRLQINVQKSAKIKAVTLKFTGKARTEWPEGIPPNKTEYYEEESLRTQIMPFFNAMHEGSDRNYGPLCHYAIRGAKPGANTSVTNLNGSASHSDRSSPTTPTGFSLSSAMARSNRNSTASLTKEQKRHSLQAAQTKSSHGVDSLVNTGPTPQQKGYKIFHPGVYEYHFEFPIGHNTPETTRLDLASVLWMLEVSIDRAGTFRPNLQGSKEIQVVRCPSEDSLELVEPISISRNWDNQLHYEIIISGKAFPLGSQIPIAFKLTPLAKVQIHKLKVFLSESVEYHTSDKKVMRKVDTRKIMLLEKAAGRPISKDFVGSEVNVLAGGEPDPPTRQRAREMARRQRAREAQQLGIEPAPLPDPSENMLGDLDLGLEGFWGQTEIEMNVQLPTCEMMRKDRSKTLHHACSWKNVNVHHWIKIVMRISRLDPDDPAGKKRRHYEISIDSPLTILSCRATQACLALPSYSHLRTRVIDEQHVCGCPNAAMSNDPAGGSPSSSNSLDYIAEPEGAQSRGIVAPPQAHLNNNAHVQRPIHLMRTPSHNPPAFDAEEPPPPMPTPPPLYDHVIGTPSVDGLADYFARLGEAYDEDYNTDDEARSNARGRVNVANPRTPGGRLARSMEIDRRFMFDVNSEALHRLNGGAVNGLGVSGV